MTWSTISRVFAAALLALSALALRAMDEAPAAGQPDPLGAARTHIAQRDWPAAIAELRRVNAADSAHWNNLMGYALRNTKPPDLAAAERHYDAALRIDPRHRGALEYSGELYLMQGRLDLAEQRLATLNRVCLLGCEEYTDLKKAIERHKAGR